jgi:hypothetical protein
MSPSTRFTTASIVAVAAAALLAGCSLVSLEPSRGSDGRVSTTGAMSADHLTVGDCYDLISADSTDVTVTPCDKPHAYLVIGQGTLTDAVVTTAGSLQNAVSSACHDSFDKVKAAVKKGEAKPKLSFLVSTSTEDPTTQKFSCVVTDAEVTAAG